MNVPTGAPFNPWPNGVPPGAAWPQYGYYAAPTYYGQGTAGWNPPPVSEDRIREIIREELTKALESLKDKS